LTHRVGGQKSTRKRYSKGLGRKAASERSAAGVSDEGGSKTIF